MRAVVWTRPFAAELRDVPSPTAESAEDVVLDVCAVGICGSDLHGYRGHSRARTAPLILGHEVVGKGADEQTYIVNPLTWCGSCARCLAGEPNLCDRRGLLGLDRPGALAERVRVPREQLTPLPNGMSATMGTLAEPLATPLQAFRQAGLASGAVVAVIGAGPIGLLSCYAARLLGAAWVGCYDLQEQRARWADPFADVTAGGPAAIRESLLDAGDGRGADIVIDAVGVEDTWRDALSLVRAGGVVAEVGLGQEEGSFPMGDVVRRGVRFQGVYAYSPADFAQAVDLLSERPPPTQWIETYPLEAGPHVLELLAEGHGPVKAVLEPERARRS
jgi:threonine dehydrogenase-like Zn-dependent dehydrogenase